MPFVSSHDLVRKVCNFSGSCFRRDGVALSFHRSKIRDHVLDLLRGQNRLAGEFPPHPIKAVDTIEGGHRRAVTEYLLCVDEDHAQARSIPAAGHAIEWRTDLTVERFRSECADFMA